MRSSRGRSNPAVRPARLGLTAARATTIPSAAPAWSDRWTDGEFLLVSPSRPKASVDHRGPLRARRSIRSSGFPRSRRVHRLLYTRDADRRDRLLATSPDPTDDGIRAGLSGNLCRCTGHVGIVAAVTRRQGSLKPTGGVGGAPVDVFVRGFVAAKMAIEPTVSAPPARTMPRDLARPSWVSPRLSKVPRRLLASRSAAPATYVARSPEDRSPRTPVGARTAAVLAMAAALRGSGQAGNGARH
jgi:hypothetical protein